MRNQAALPQALPVLAQMLADSFNVNLRIEGTQAFTDGRDITLPMLDLRNESASVLTLGYLVHEVGHITDTDFTIAIDPNSPLLKHVFNCLEDARIEYRMQIKYPGSRAWLETLNTSLLVIESAAVANVDVIDTFTNYILSAVFSLNLNYPMLEPQTAVLRTKMNEYLGQELTDFITQQLADVHLLSSSGEVLTRAKMIVDRLADQANSTPNQKTGQPQSDETQRSSSEYGDKADGGNGSSADGSDSPIDQGKPEGCNSQGDQGQGMRQASGSANSKASTPATQQQQANLQGLLSATKSQLPKDKGEEVASQLSQLAYNTNPKDAYVSPLVSDYAVDNLRFFNPTHVLGEVNFLRARLRALLKANTKQRKRFTDHGRLVATRCHLLEVGRLDVFEHKTRSETVDTAIQVLLDVSDSMNEEVYGYGTRLSLAKDALAAIALSLEGISHISLEVASFNSDKHRRSYFTVLKSFKTRSVDGLRSALATLKASGGTPLNTAVATGASRILARKEARKLVIIITDGLTKTTQVNPFLEDIGKAGVETLAIGLGTEQVKFLNCQSLVINQINELSTRLLEKLTSMLTINRQAA